MPVALIQTNFTAGELSERLGGRVDLSRWSNGVEILENMVIHPHGGATRRPGLRFIREVEGRNRVQNPDFAASEGWTAGSGWIIDTAGRKATCDGSQSGPAELTQDVEFAENLTDIVRFTLSDRSAGQVRIKAGDGDEGPWISENGPYEIRLDGGPDNTNLVIEADAYFAGSITEVSVRRADPKTRIIPFEFSTTQSYILELTDKNMRVYKNGGIVTESDKPVEIAAEWTEEDLEAIRWTQSADVMYLVHPELPPKKLSRTSHVDWTLKDISFTSPPSEWNEDNGYPSCCTFFEERLCFASSPKHPQRIWMSKSGDYQNFGVSNPVVEDDACTYTLSADQVNRIRALVPGSKLVILTSGGEWWLSGGSGTDTVTPLSVMVRRETTHGAADIAPAPIGQSVIFLQRDGKKIRELAYAFENDGYQAKEMSILSEHLTRNNTITRWAFQQSPDSVLWMVRDDGILLGMTYEQSHEVTAFHRHTTEGQFEDVACIPNDTGQELWTVVRRTIDNRPRRYIERMDPAFDGETTNDAFFVDCGLSYKGDPAEEFNGADHLEGCRVDMLADGAVRPSTDVTDGGFRINGKAAEVHAGLPYESNLRTLRMEGGAIGGGTAQGRTKRISNLTVRLYKSLGMKVGGDEATLRSVPFRTSSAPMDGPPALFTGDYALNFGGGYTKEGQVHIRQSQPLPLTVLALIPEASVYGP